jgi:DNA repair protein RecO (recombination protein O)
MFTHYRTKGIIIKKVDRNEADQLFTVYTEDFGKIDVLGRGIRKTASKLRSGIETIYFSEIEFIQGKNYKTLTDAILIDNFWNLRKDLERLALALKISENLDNLIHNQETDLKIWNLVTRTFQELNNPNFKFSIYNLQYYYFFWNLLSVLGYRPELYNCPVCRQKLKPEKIYFNQEEGGVICRNCFLKKKESGVEVELNAIKVLRIILDKKKEIIYKLKIEDNSLNSLRDLSQKYLSFLLDRDIKSDILKV